MLKGINWIKRHYKDHRVHAVNFPGDPYPIHIDATFTPIKEGLIINNPQRRLPKEQKKLFYGLARHLFVKSVEDCPGDGEITQRQIYNPSIHPQVGDIHEALLQPSPPSSRHLLGTDSLGRDIFSQIMEGSQVAFLLGLLSAIIGVSISTILGTIAAFYGGRVDAYLMRQSDLVLMLPSLPLLFIISAFAELKIWHLAIVLGVIGGLGGSVITIKSQALQVKVKPFVDSARITGGSNMTILFSHILPNVAPLALLFMVFSVTGAIASESILSFLGLLNIEMSWGIMIYLSQTDGYIFSGMAYWWLILPAGLAVTFLAGGFYLVGRGLDDVFNPRLRKR